MLRTGGAFAASPDARVRLRGPALPHITRWSSFALPLEDGDRHTTIVLILSSHAGREARGGRSRRASWDAPSDCLRFVRCPAAVRQRRRQPRPRHRPHPVRSHRVARSGRVLRRAADRGHPDKRRIPVDWNPGRFDPFRRRAVHALAAAEGISSSERSDLQTPGSPRREPLDRHLQRTGAVARPEPRDPCAGGALRHSPRRPSGHDLGGTHAGAGASAPLPFCARGLPVFRVPGRARAQLCPGSA